MSNWFFGYTSGRFHKQAEEIRDRDIRTGKLHSQAVEGLSRYLQGKFERIYAVPTFSELAILFADFPAGAKDLLFLPLFPKGEQPVRGHRLRRYGPDEIHHGTAGDIISLYEMGLKLYPLVSSAVVPAIVVVDIGYFAMREFMNGRGGTPRELLAITP